jgi:hypothetical protein
VPAKYIVAVQPSSKQRLVLKEKRMSTSFLSASMVTEAPERSMKPELNRVSFVKRFPELRYNPAQQLQTPIHGKAKKVNTF